MDNSSIFDGAPVKLAMSAKNDGHMSFGKVDDAKTYANINRFLAISLPERRQSAFIRVTYGDKRTYDTITDINGRSLSKELTPDNRITADALITTDPGTALLLPVADCYPFVLYDPQKCVLALAHMGWQASHANLLGKLVRELWQDYHCDPAGLLIFAGPGIRPEHYVFKDTVQKNLPEWQVYLHKTESGYGIDLLGFNLNVLKNAGVPEANIEVSPRNTVDDPNLESHYHHTKAGLPPARRYLLGVMMVPDRKL